MDASLMPLIGDPGSRGTEPVGAFAFCAGDAFEGLGDIKGALQWLHAGPTGGPPAAQASGPKPQAAAGPGDRPAEALACTGQSLPGDRVAAVSACPGKVFDALRDFFRRAVPAVVEEQAEDLELSAVAFLNYAATHVKAFVRVAGAGEPGAALVFRHTSQRDVVRCGQLWAAALDHLLAQRLPVVLPGGAPPRAPPGGLLLDDDFDDLDDLDDLGDGGWEGALGEEAGAAGAPWRERAEAALAAAASASAAAQEEGLAALASWAARRPGARPAIAAALAARPALVAALLLEAPVELLYPLAVALELAAAQGGAALAGLAGAIAPALRAGPPPIVERALRGAAEHLRPRAELRSASKERWDLAILSSEDLPARAYTWSDALVLGAEAPAALGAAAAAKGCRLRPALARGWGAFRADTTGNLPLLF